MTVRDDGKGPAESYVGGPVRFLSRNFQDGIFELVTSPIPAAKVTVFFNPKNGLWYHRVTSEVLTGAYVIKSPLLASADEYRQAALAKGAQVATAYALMKWRDQFTPGQRYAMGHQRCPYIKGCTESPVTGSVWCRWHPMGKVKGK